MSLNIFLTIGQITSVGNTELWLLSFRGTCLKRKWQQSCRHFLNYCIPTDTSSKFGAKILLIIFLFEDTFENTIDDAMDPFSRNKKIHTYTKFGISGKSNYFPKKYSRIKKISTHTKTKPKLEDATWNFLPQSHHLNWKRFPVINQ